MLMDILMEALMSMDDESLDYVLESCDAEELEIISNAMEARFEDGPTMPSKEQLKSLKNKMIDNRASAIAGSYKKQFTNQLMKPEYLLNNPNVPKQTKAGALRFISNSVNPENNYDYNKKLANKRNGAFAAIGARLSTDAAKKAGQSQTETEIQKRGNIKLRLETDGKIFDENYYKELPGTYAEKKRQLDEQLKQHKKDVKKMTRERDRLINENNRK